jgi:hypothetical protein
MTALDTTSDVVTITPPGSTEVVHLRYPTFQEWHALAKAHRELQRPDGTRATPPADLIVKTITACVSDADGKPAGLEAAKVLRANHQVVMWIYAQLWETVLKSGDAVVADIEKNSEAGKA